MMFSVYVIPGPCLEDGSREWQGGRCGNGQLVLLPDQDLLLLVLSEEGDMALVGNDQEMAAFRLPLAGG